MKQTFYVAMLLALPHLCFSQKGDRTLPIDKTIEKVVYDSTSVPDSVLQWKIIYTLNSQAKISEQGDSIDVLKLNFVNTQRSKATVEQGTMVRTVIPPGTMQKNNDPVALQKRYTVKERTIELPGIKDEKVLIEEHSKEYIEPFIQNDLKNISEQIKKQ